MITKKCIVIGDTVLCFKSSEIHNYAYKILDIKNKYIFHTYTTDLKKNNGIEKLKLYIKEHNVADIGVTMPNKKIAVLCACATVSSTIYKVFKHSKNISIYNNIENNKIKLAKTFGIMYCGSISDIDVDNFDFIINIATVSFNDLESSPIKINNNHMLDAIYKSIKNKIIIRFRKNVAKIIFRTNMFFNLVIEQIYLYTSVNLIQDQIDILRSNLVKNNILIL